MFEFETEVVIRFQNGIGTESLKIKFSENYFATLYVTLTWVVLCKLIRIQIRCNVIKKWTRTNSSLQRTPDSINRNNKDTNSTDLIKNRWIL